MQGAYIEFHEVIFPRKQVARDSEVIWLAKQQVVSNPAG